MIYFVVGALDNPRLHVTTQDCPIYRQQWHLCKSGCFNSLLSLI